MCTLQLEYNLILKKYKLSVIWRNPNNATELVIPWIHNLPRSIHSEPECSHITITHSVTKRQWFSMESWAVYSISRNQETDLWSQYSNIFQSNETDRHQCGRKPNSLRCSSHSRRSCYRIRIEKLEWHWETICKYWARNACLCVQSWKIPHVRFQKAFHDWIRSQTAWSNFKQKPDGSSCTSTMDAITSATLWLHHYLPSRERNGSSWQFISSTL